MSIMTYQSLSSISEISENEITLITSHFSSSYSKSILNFIQKDLFKESEYAFIENSKVGKIAYCTSCHQEYASNWKHNSREVCPCCRKTVLVKHAHYGRKYLVDEGYFVTYSKSLIDKSLVVARGIRVFRDFRTNYKKNEPIIVDEAFYILDKKPSHVSRHVYFSLHDNCVRVYDFTKRASLFSHAKTTLRNKCGSYLPVVELAIHKQSIKSAVKNTIFENSGWNIILSEIPFSYSKGQHYTQYHHCNDLIAYFNTFMKYPCFEYLIKLGFKHLVIDRLLSFDTYGCSLNFRAKTLHDVLKITKANATEIIKSKRNLTYSELFVLQSAKKDGYAINYESAIELSNSLSEYSHSYLKNGISKYTSIYKAILYIDRQCKKGIGRPGTLYVSYKDYLNECTQLGWDLSKKSTLFPSNLSERHAKASSIVKHIADEKLQKQIEEFLLDLSDYFHETDKYIIRPFFSAQEVIDEGKALTHCVGGYVASYANRKTILLAIRKKELPLEPFYTMEYRDNRVAQVQTYNHLTPEEMNNLDVINLVNEFHKKITSIKSIKKVA